MMLRLAVLLVKAETTQPHHQLMPPTNTVCQMTPYHDVSNLHAGCVECSPGIE